MIVHRSSGVSHKVASLNGAREQAKPMRRMDVLVQSQTGGKSKPTLGTGPVGRRVVVGNVIGQLFSVKQWGQEKGGIS